LAEGDYLVGIIAVENNEQDVLVVSENGYGKRSDIEAYRLIKRGGKGVKTMNITEKTGKLVSVQSVTDDDELIIINSSGITIRLAVSTLRTMGRATQGVRLINLRDGDTIASVTKVKKQEEDDIEEVEVLNKDNPNAETTENTDTE